MTRQCDGCGRERDDVRTVLVGECSRFDAEEVDACTECRPLADGEPHPDPMRDPNVYPRACPEGYKHRRWDWDERAERWECLQCAIEDIALDRAGL